MENGQLNNRMMGQLYYKKIRSYQFCIDRILLFSSISLLSFAYDNILVSGSRHRDEMAANRNIYK